MRSVLMIAYMFPPIGGIGVQRTVQFAKYLPQFGWRPVILTVTESNDFILDAELGDTIPPEVTIHRAPSWEPLNAGRVKQVANRVEVGNEQSSAKKRVLDGLKAAYAALRIPDDKIGWWPHAVRLGRQIVLQENIDLIYATAPPYTNFLVGQTLKRATGLPLVLDYRDEWSTIEYRALPTNRVTLAANRKMERNALRAADGVVSALLPLEAHLRTADLLPQATTVDFIPNGYDPADLNVADPDSLRCPNKLVIVYTGTFYGERQTPEYFLRGLHAFLEGRADARPYMEVRIVGSIFGRHSRFIDELELGDVVEVWGVVSHKMAVSHQLAADLLLLVIGNGPGSDMVLTGKIFEYLGARRPIFALVPPDGPAAQLIHNTKTGTVVDAADVNAIADKLTALYNEWAAGSIQFTPDEDKIRQYDRRSLTADIAELFDGMVANDR